MTVSIAMTAGLLVLTGAVLLLGLAAVVAHLVRDLRTTRTARLAQPARRYVIRLTADESDDTAMSYLVDLDTRHWAAVKPNAAGLLGTLSGTSHRRLVELFERRGITEQAMRDTARSGAVRRARACETLGRLRHRPAVSALCRLLDDGDSDVRQVAARALGLIGVPAAAGPLLDTLAAERTIPESIVTQALLRIGPTAQPALTRAMTHPDPRVRRVAIEATGRVGGHMATSEIATALRDDRDLEVRVRAVRALGRLGLPGNLAVLVTAARDEHTIMRTAAIRALRDLGSARAVPTLRDALADPAIAVAREAAGFLAELGTVGRQPLNDADQGALGPRAAAIACEALAIATLREQRRAAAQTLSPILGGQP